MFRLSLADFAVRLNSTQAASFLIHLICLLLCFLMDYRSWRSRGNVLIYRTSVHILHTCLGQPVFLKSATVLWKRISTCPVILVDFLHFFHKVCALSALSLSILTVISQNLQCMQRKESPSQTSGFIILYLIST